MRAAVFIKPGQPLEIRDLPDPTPGPDEVVLRIERCGICGTDLHYTEDHADTFPTGFIAGHESGAEVVAIGKDVDFLKVGDHVVPHPIQGCGKCADCTTGSPYFCSSAGYNMGGFGQYKLSRARACIPLPKQLSLRDAAIVEPLTCGLLGASSAPVTPGSTVVVLGAGPIGLSAMHWARRMGAGKVVGGARTTQRAALAARMGADKFFAVDEEFQPNVIEYLGGPPDIVLECVGVPGILGKCIDLVRVRGTVVVLGVCFHGDTIVPARALLKEITIKFAVGTHLKQFRTVADSLAAGHIEPLDMVTDTISLNDLPTAFEALRTRTTQCKVLLDPWR
jgi:(R,R)-butanediol dehydrogenase/meso-butanediol dehydrogenase/diacetyl reductase